MRVEQVGRRSGPEVRAGGGGQEVPSGTGWDFVRTSAQAPLLPRNLGSIAFIVPIRHSFWFEADTAHILGDTLRTSDPFSDPFLDTPPPPAELAPRCTEHHLAQSQDAQSMRNKGLAVLGGCREHKL